MSRSTNTLSAPHDLDPYLGVGHDSARLSELIESHDNASAYLHIRVIEVCLAYRQYEDNASDRVQKVMVQLIEGSSTLKTIQLEAILNVLYAHLSFIKKETSGRISHQQKSAHLNFFYTNLPELSAFQRLLYSVKEVVTFLESQTAVEEKNAEVVIHKSTNVDKLCSYAYGFTRAIHEKFYQLAFYYLDLMLQLEQTLDEDTIKDKLRMHCDGLYTDLEELIKRSGHVEPVLSFVFRVQNKLDKKPAFAELKFAFNAIFLELRYLLQDFGDARKQTKKMLSQLKLRGGAVEQDSLAIFPTLSLTEANAEKLEKQKSLMIVSLTSGFPVKKTTETQLKEYMNIARNCMLALTPSQNPEFISSIEQFTVRCIALFLKGPKGVLTAFEILGFHARYLALSKNEIDYDDLLALFTRTFVDALLAMNVSSVPGTFNEIVLLGSGIPSWIKPDLAPGAPDPELKISNALLSAMLKFGNEDALKRVTRILATNRLTVLASRPLEPSPLHNEKLAILSLCESLVTLKRGELAMAIQLLPQDNRAFSNQPKLAMWLSSLKFTSLPDFKKRPRPEVLVYFTRLSALLKKSDAEVEKLLTVLLTKEKKYNPSLVKDDAESKEQTETKKGERTETEAEKAARLEKLSIAAEAEKAARLENAKIAAEVEQKKTNENKLNASINETKAKLKQLQDAAEPVIKLAKSLEDSEVFKEGKSEDRKNKIQEKAAKINTILGSENLKGINNKTNFITINKELDVHMSVVNQVSAYLSEESKALERSAATLKKSSTAKGGVFRVTNNSNSTRNTNGAGDGPVPRRN